jgi:hypothetical protein
MMVSLSVRGTLGKFGYSNIPDDIIDQILMVATMQAYKTAVQKAPFDPDDPPVHIREELRWNFSKLARMGTVWVRLAYANMAEYGSKGRAAHPFIRPAKAAAQRKMRAVIKRSTQDAVRKRKVK